MVFSSFIPPLSWWFLFHALLRPCRNNLDFCRGSTWWLPKSVDLVTAVWMSYHIFPSWGTIPCISRGRGCAVCDFLSPGDVAIVVGYFVHRYSGSWFASSFFTAWQRFVTPTTLQTAGVIFSEFTATGHAFHTVRAALLAATNRCMLVVSCYELVGSGNRETPDV